MPEKSTIRFPERFDFDYHKKFSEAYEPLLNDKLLKEIELDFSLVQYLDSSALGMLVLLYKKFNSAHIGLSIIGAKGTAKEIIDMANLSKLYKIK